MILIWLGGYDLLSSIYTSTGQYENALKYLDIVILFEKEKEVPVEKDLGIAFYKRGYLKIYNLNQIESGLKDLNIAKELGNRKAVSIISKLDSNNPIDETLQAKILREGKLRRMIEEANDLLDKDMFVESYEMFKKCLEIDSCNIEVLCNIGLTLNNIKDYERARFYLEKAHQIAPYDVCVICNLSISLSDLNQNEEAIRILKIATNKNFQDFQIYNSLGWCYQKIGQYYYALENYNDAISLEENPDTYSNRGKLKIDHLNDIEGGIKDLKIAESLGDIMASLELDKLN
jgi:tetratricopeptide (TPR) repeat protein